MARLFFFWKRVRGGVGWRGADIDQELKVVPEV
jgi:hypothetical protein